MKRYSRQACASEDDEGGRSIRTRTTKRRRTTMTANISWSPSGLVLLFYPMLLLMLFFSDTAYSLLGSGSLHRKKSIIRDRLPFGVPSSSSSSPPPPSFGAVAETKTKTRLYARWNPRARRRQPKNTTTTTTTGILEEDKLVVEKDGTSSATTKEHHDDHDEDSSEEVDKVWNWNASGSFGSLLMQLQKKEEAMIANNESLLEEEGPPLVVEAVDLDHLDDDDVSRGDKVEEELFMGADGMLVEDVSLREEEPSRQLEEPEPVIISRMDSEMAKELDEAVIPLTASAETLAQDMTVLPLDPLYTQQAVQPSAESEAEFIDGVEEPLLRLSRQEHYHDRVDQDVRHLAVNIASSIESVAQWRLFCQEGGGLFPLLETIRQGAANLHHTTATPSSKGGTQGNKAEAIQQPETANAAAWGSHGMWDPNNHNNHHHIEETFLASCNSCRALRDLCAISPELAAVLTDGILRYNQAYDGGLFEDFSTFLKYANTVDVDPQHHVSGGFRSRWRQLRDARLRCKLYVTQLLLAMTIASDDAVAAIRSTPGLDTALLQSSSYARKEQTRRWLRYPGELIKYFWRLSRKQRLRLFKVVRRKRRSVFSSSSSISILNRGRRSQRRRLRRPFLEAANVANDLNGQVQKTANQVLAAVGYNRWIPRIPGQKGLRILCLDGGGSRGMTAVTAVKELLDYVGDGMQVADCFDLVAGTSTGGIIAFLTGLRGETAEQAARRYNLLIKQVFVKSALSTPRMVFTTATYDESHFMEILCNILGDETMLDSRADPSTPYVFAVTSIMSSTPTHVALCRNYNYASGELSDNFTLDPNKAREELDLPLDLENELLQQKGEYNRTRISRTSPGLKVSDGSRHPGSFRVLQRYALRASTAAPTVFKPVMMGGEMYCDGGIVASNPTAVAIHEARTLFPDVPIEMVVSCGTGGFVEQKTTGRFGWDAIIGQIVGSATDGEQIHHILEDILGDPSIGSSVSKTAYYRFNPVIGPPDDFPIDVTEPEKLALLRQITTEYMNEPTQQDKMEAIADVLKGKPKWRKWLSSHR